MVESDANFTLSGGIYYPQTGGGASNAGTYDGTNAPRDIYGNTRANPPDIGCYEIGGSIPTAIDVGVSWEGSYTVHGYDTGSSTTTTSAPGGLIGSSITGVTIQ